MGSPSNRFFGIPIDSVSAAVFACALALVSVPSALSAQVLDDQTAAAREHFREGLALADRGDWAISLLEFERALTLHDSPAVRVNLAHALEHLGRLIDALEQLDHLEDGGPASRAVQDEAETLRDELTPRIGRIVVAVRGETTDTEVRVAGQAIARDEWHAPIAADPGSVTVELRQGERVVDAIEVSVPEGGVAHVTLGVATDTSPRSVARADGSGELGVLPASAMLGGEGSSAHGENVLETWWFWTIVGVVAAGTAAGVTAGVLLSTPEAPTSGNFMPGIVEIGP